MRSGGQSERARGRACWPNTRSCIEPRKWKRITRKCGETMTTFWLIRHAETDTAGNTITGRLPGVHLNGNGRRQTELLVSQLRPAPLTAIYASPLERARETAAPLAQA